MELTSSTREIVLAVDPSLRATGYAIVAFCHGPGPNRARCCEYGVLRLPPELPVAACLLHIHENLAEVIARYHPTVLAIESTIYVQSYRTAIVLGAARGAVLLAAAQKGMVVEEFAPRSVKQAVVGRGAASKEQVAFMVRTLFGLEETPPADAADALAVALTYGQNRWKKTVQI